MLINFLKQIFMPITIIGICIALLYSAYNDVKRETINQLNLEQLTHAEQAANGIQLFFNDYDMLLSYLAKQNSIIDFNENGKNLATLFYDSHAPEIQAITRIDENGKIIFTVPNNPQFAGKDISYQEHIQRILKTHQRVLSDIFETVQGFRSIAYYLPVFKNGIFKGGIAILIPFESLAKNYLRNIKVRQSGFAWTVSQKGVVIYSPFTVLNNKNVFQRFSKNPELISLLNRATKGERGSGFYSWANPNLPETDSGKICAVYYPVKIADRFWSVIVATPETEALSTMNGFINKWATLIILLIFGGSVYLYYVNKARAILKEETKRKKAEEALRQSEQKFKTLFHTAGDSIFLVELNDKIIETNDYALEKFGYTREEFLDFSMGELNFPPDSERIKNRLGLIKEKGELYFESVFKTKRGEPIHVGVNVRIIDYEDRKVMLSIARDISLKKKEEEELIRAKDEAEIASRLKSEFLAQMSHEIRSPLNVVMGFTELLKDDLKGQLTEDMVNSFKGIDIAGKRIIRTVELILNMSELQAGMYESIRKKFDLSKDVLEAILHEYEIVARKRGLDLILSKKTDRTIINADLFSTSQIFVNLIDNAIKYTPIGKVEITVTRNERNELTVIISDTGIGISKEFLPKLFEPFTQEQQGYSRKYEGTGLGMALVKRYCEINGVEIQVDTDKNRGTKFILCFADQNEQQ
ncbi:MAG: ATP-binding protein [Ignavibacteriales bacterium]|nr:ATP-binding protein [Ignavibacteriales bacterium]